MRSVKRTRAGRKRPARTTSTDVLLTLRTVNPRDAYEAERERHLTTRPCVVDGCDETVPCPEHGTPAEDAGEWLWNRGDPR